MTRLLPLTPPIVKDIAAADELFKRALAVDCMHSGVTTGYVEFLEKNLEGDYR
jgi:hypothetical protein